MNWLVRSKFIFSIFYLIQQLNYNTAAATLIDQKKELPSATPKIALIIDDIGYRLEIVKKFIQLKIPITFSLLPESTYFQEILLLAKKHSIEIMLHMPMEPIAWPKTESQKDSFLLINDDRKAIINKLTSSIRQFPSLLGVNNHMGSRFTSNNEGMKTVLSVLKKEGLFFLDSKTAPGKLTYKLAKKMNVKFFARNIFLDHKRDLHSIKKQLNKSLFYAKKQGRCIVIGHPLEQTYQALKSKLTNKEIKGVQFTKISSLL